MIPKKIVRNKLEKILHVKNSVVKDWLISKGFTGELGDALNAYLQTKTSVSGNLPDLLNATLTSLGFTGTLGDKVNAFYVSKTGVSYSRDAGRKFWSDSSLDFGASGNFILNEDGTSILNEDGTKILQE